ncbi:MAG: hypothetical protein V1744_01215 [Candidatus Altiarchaeota archaeon]
MGNCGRCGKPMFNPGEAVCESCKKTISRGASKHADRMNRRMDEQAELFMNIAAPGGDEDVKGDMRHEHYVNTHDASAVWADGGAKKGGSRKQ